MRLRLLGLVLLGAGSLAPSTSSAAAPWGSPLGVAPVAPSIDRPVLGPSLLTWSAGPSAGGPRSRVLAPLDSSSGVAGTARRVGTVVGAPVEVSPSMSVYLRRQTIDRAGDVERIGVSVGTTGGALGTPRWVGRGRLAEDPVMAVAPSGAAVIAWTDGMRLLVALRRAGSLPGRARIIRGSGPIDAVSVGISPGGRWVVAYLRDDAVEARSGTVAAGPAPGVMRLGPSLGEVQTATAVASDGAAVVAYRTQEERVAAARFAPRVYAAVRRPGQPFEAARVLDEGAEPAHPPGRVDVALAPDGRATVAWSGVATGQRLTVRSATQGPDRVFGAASDLGSLGALQDLAIGPRGDAVAVWTGSDVDGGTRAGVAAAVRPAGGVWQAPEVVADGPLGALDAGSVSFLADGRPVVAWVGTEGGAEQVKVAVRDAIAPPPSLRR